MSRHNLIDPSDRPERPARRQALFTARDVLVAMIAAPALPKLAWAADAKAAAVAPLRVVHGFIDHQGILLWMQGARAHRVRVEVRERSASATRLPTIEAELDPRADCTATIPIAGLDQGTLHQYLVRHSGSNAVLAKGSFKTQPLWQWRTDPPTVRIAAGSCAYLNDPRLDRPGKPYGGGNEIFDSIAATSPDLMLWLGDNLYLREADYTSREGINRRYRFYRSHPSMQKLWTACPHVAIWDDHDFGPNDSDASYSGRGWTREMFRRYWPLPYSPPSDGNYGQLLQGDVDIFLLDDRSYRYPNRWPDGPDKVMYGPKQMQWLKAALTFSRAPFKIVAGGNQFWNKVSVDESWAKFPAEQQAFRRWLDEVKIPGVIFLSGDRHFSEMLRVERTGLYPIHELTTSPLTASAYADPGDTERGNIDLVPGSMLNERNFAMITVTGPGLQRTITIELMDTRGAKKWEWRATAQELGNPPPPPPRTAT